MIVTARHALTIPGFSRKRGFCVPGLRRWFRTNGLDLADFMRNGIEEEKLLAVGDAFAIATVKWAHECAAREAGDGR